MSNKDKLFPRCLVCGHCKNKHGARPRTKEAFACKVKKCSCSKYSGNLEMENKL